MNRAAQPKAAMLPSACNGLAEKYAFLMHDAWPDGSPPHCIETHASLIFLKRDRAYKLKKPVMLPHADMRSLAMRAALCAEELRLNRALAGDVYLGLVALVRRPDGALDLGGPGRVVDWLVEMVRLPEAQMLDKRLINGPQPRRDEITDFGQVMITFYRHQIAPPHAGATYFDRLTREMVTDLRHLAQMRNHPSAARMLAPVAIPSSTTTATLPLSGAVPRPPSQSARRRAISAKAGSASAAIFARDKSAAWAISSLISRVGFAPLVTAPTASSG